MAARGGKDDRRQADLFAGLFPVRRPPIANVPALAGFDSTLKRSISRALKEHPESREIVAARMAELLGEPSWSKAMLDKCTSEASEDHRIGASRLLALIVVTGATWLLDLLAEQAGCVVMEGEEARLAERGLIRQQIEELQRREKALARLDPVKVRRRSVQS